MSMWMILRIRFLSIGRMLFDLKPAKDPSSIECVRLACSTVPPRRRAVHIIRAETITYAQLSLFRRWQARGTLIALGK